MGERLINPLLNIQKNVRYKEMIFINPYRFNRAYDIDAKAYIDAVLLVGGTLSDIEKAAIDDFFLGLKSDGLYSKIKRLYLFVGVNINAYLINGINPGVYDMTLINLAYTINNLGYKLDDDTGGNGALDFEDLSIDHVSFNTHLATYITEDTLVPSVQYDINFGNWGLFVSFQGTFPNIVDTYNVSNRITTDNYSKVGLFLDNVQSNVSHRFIRDGVLSAQNTSINETTLSNGMSGVFGRGSKRHCFFSTGESFTEIEEELYSYRINELQKGFSRNTY